MQKRRNAWALGAVVAGKLLQLDALRDASDFDDSMTKNAAVREWKQLSCGVKNLASYIVSRFWHRVPGLIAAWNDR